MATGNSFWLLISVNCWTSYPEFFQARLLDKEILE
jgi:hypothetical protein